MIFNEIYGVYYDTVSKIIAKILEKGSLEKGELLEIVEKYAFSDSYIEISQAIKDERWLFLTKDFKTCLKNPPKTPLTTLQLRWLRSLLEDKRFKLFVKEIPYQLWCYEPLFLPGDIEFYDKYEDSDPYENDFYKEVFHTILEAIESQSALELSFITRADKARRVQVLPKRLEYSQKDDKFRLIVSGNKDIGVINLSTIVFCKAVPKLNWLADKSRVSKTKTLTLELTDKRNTLERLMLHFAHFKKQARKTDKDKYTVQIEYSAQDESELLIRVLSFGPTVRAVAPQDFVELIKARLEKQRLLFSSKK